MLPHSRTVEMCIAKTMIYPGFLEPVLKNLTETLKGLPECARSCVVKMDEMDIMERIEYDFKMDIIEGFEHLGHLGRSERRSNKVFVVTVNGSHPIHRWRVIAYYGITHNNVYSEDIATLMRQMSDKTA